MKVLLCLLFVLPLKGFSQFTGEVFYKEVYESKIPGINNQDFQRYTGDSRRLYIGNGSYKNENNSLSISRWIYRGSENKLYFFRNNSDTIVWCDASLRKFEKTSFTPIEKTDEVILGHKCKKVTLRSESSTVTYYFSDAYPLDPRGYAQHFFESWNLYTSLAKAVPLKIILENKDMKLTSTAVRIESKSIDWSVFEVPKGILKEMH